MLKVYGVKINKETGEIIKEKTLIFSCISEYNLKNTGIKNAISNGYIITEIIEIATLKSRFADIKIY